MNSLQYKKFKKAIIKDCIGKTLLVGVIAHFYSAIYKKHISYQKTLKYIFKNEV